MTCLVRAMTMVLSGEEAEVTGFGASWRKFSERSLALFERQVRGRTLGDIRRGLPLVQPRPPCRSIQTLLSNCRDGL